MSKVDRQIIENHRKRKKQKKQKKRKRSITSVITAVPTIKHRTLFDNPKVGVSIT